MAPRPSSMPLAIVSGSLLCLQLCAEDITGRERERKQIIREEISTELRIAVARGFRWLVSQQNPRGDFDSRHPVAVNALVGLAFLAGGHSERAGGEHTATLRAGTTALLARQNTQGYFDDGESAMYGHGFATLYLAELYGTSDHRPAEIRTALEKAIRVIEVSQASTGGWDYSPAEGMSDERRHSGASDTSITVCQTLALRAADNLGIRLNGGVRRRAQRYIENAQNDDGGFRYRQLSFDSHFLKGSAFPRSAAGVCVLYSLGNYNSEKIKKGFEYLYKQYRFPWSNEFPYYGHFYCAQAMFQGGGKYWAEYFPWIREELLKKQEPDGGWKASAREDRGQATAMALIILELPFRFLPIHER